MSEQVKNRIAIAVTSLGAVFLLLGVIRGEDTVVWRKAVNVCMECIGLG